MEEQRAKRFKRMQAFQARSGMQNLMNIEEPHSDNNEEGKTVEDGSEDGEVVDEGANFYKSYNELEELEKKKLHDIRTVEQQHKTKTTEEIEGQGPKDENLDTAEKINVDKEVKNIVKVDSTDHKKKEGGVLCLKKPARNV